MRLMKSGAGAAILGLIVASLGNGFGAEGVAPTRAEIAAMYRVAVEEVNAGKYAEALKQLDAIDARQPDLAGAKNLRGIALMKLKEYGLAEKALQKARELDPNLWEARFNLAELSFLQKKWAAAREGFEKLAAEPDEPGRKATNDLIQFKIFLTDLLGGREQEATAMRDRFELSVGNPLRYYARAAFAFREKDETSARVNLRAAEKSSSRESHELFLESFYEVGWMEKSDDARPVALKMESQADRIASAKIDFKKAERALRDGDYDRGLELLAKVDEATPNQAAVYNLRGEILLAQGKLDAAEAAFRSALVANPELEAARYNLARLPFKKREYETAQKDFEALLGAINRGKPEREHEELIRYHLYLALLLQGHDSAAQKALDEFKMMDQTPALYYAQAAWAFRHGNPKQAGNWIANANNLFSPELNRSFAAPLAEVGWLGSGSEGTGPGANAGEAASSTPMPIAAAATPAATPHELARATPAPVSVASESEVATPSPSPMPEASAAETTAAAAAKKSGRRAGEKSEARSNKEERKKRTRRREEREDETRPARRAKAHGENRTPVSSTPSPSPAPTPGAVVEPEHQNLGDKVRNLILYPFHKRGEKSATPAPSPRAQGN
jgi:tetratricopeptide (TPR) repeat protein